MPNTPDPWLVDALGNEPFPWQSRLLARLLAGHSPAALDLPTGLGKTSVMAIWLVARARGATALPRRLVYVVDRRAVVDQATREAERLREWARSADVAGALGLGGRSLPVSTLRGQFVDNRAWLEDPSAPAIVVGTVDMIGSRLLFEGYAASRKMRPYHAGMLGCDTWFVLDESHLVPPFARMLDAVCSDDALWGRRAAGGPRAAWLGLSATGRSAETPPFCLEDDDLVHPVVRRRVEAVKRARMVDLGKRALPEALAAEAWAIASAAEGPTRVLVFSDRRDDAERAQRELLKLARKARERRDPLPETCLFVGGRRVRERTRAAEQLDRLGFLAGSEPPADHTFVFATSAGEVGVDLDAQHAVMDVVAWERMVQRLGRVNRRGDAPAQVVIVGDPEAPWTQPVSQLLGALPADPRGVDVSPAAFAEIRRTHGPAIETASTPSPLWPALERATVDAWSMTSLREHPGRPEVRPWLRGWVDDPPQTTVVWRSRLPPADAPPGTWSEYFEAAAPHASERLDTETYKVVVWLRDRARDCELDDDHPAAWVLDGGPTWTLGELRAALGNPKALQRALSGQMLVVHASLGGLSEEGLLDPKASDAPLTGEVGAEDWIVVDAGGAPAVPFRVVERAVEDEEASRDRAGVEEPTPAPWYPRLRIPVAWFDEQVSRWLVIEKWRTDSATEDDRSAGPPQRLDEHHAWTADRAAGIADRLGLSERLREVLVVAARLHDAGKQAARWQRAFRAPADGPYAKTRGPVDVRHLDGYRHELGSLPYVAADPGFAALSDEEQDLALHLVAAHHGHARPTIPTRGCDDAPPSRLRARAQEVAMRFARLQERFGPWGLAWLEVLLRAADQMASRANQEREDA